MSIYTLHREQHLPISITEAWNFFSAAGNLSKITPPEMKFIIQTDLIGKTIHSGMKIEYSVSPLLNIPLHWITEIINVHEPYSFTDKQIKGPYKLWEHTHTFQETATGVKMTDEVRYALPMGWVGDLAHSLIVKHKLDNIFDFREKTLVNLFSVK